MGDLSALCKDAARHSIGYRTEATHISLSCNNSDQSWTYLHVDIQHGDCRRLPP